jgi:hypothetical protein
MSKTSYFLLLCSVLAVPFLGSSSARAFTIINQFGQCLEDRGGDTTDRTPIVNQICTGRFPQQWNWDGGSITGIPAPALDGSGGTFPTCLTAFGNADGTPVTLVTCHAACRNGYAAFPARSSMWASESASPSRTQPREHK